MTRLLAIALLAFSSLTVGCKSEKAHDRHNTYGTPRHDDDRTEQRRNDNNHRDYNRNHSQDPR